MFRARLLSAVVAFAAMALLATAQPPFESPPPGPVILNLSGYIGDKNLTAELKLTDEQVKKLTDHRKKDWDAEYTTAPAEFGKTQEARIKATVALFKEVLTPDQHTRATQLMAQDVLRNYRGGFGGPGGRAALPPVNVVRVSASTLRMYPEIADAAKLTAEQKKVVEASGKGGFGPGDGFGPPGGGGFGGRGGGRFGGPFGYSEPRVVLAPDQSESLKKFLGPIGTQSFRMSFDNRGQLGYGGGPGLGGEHSLETLVYRPVQSELKLTEEQIRTVSDLQLKNETFYSQEANNLSPEKAVAREKELTAEIEKELAKLLNKEQAARLKQLQIWMQIGPSVDHITRYQIQPIAEGIGLSDAQKKALADVNTAYREETLKAFEADEAIDVLKKRLAAATETRAAAVEKVITVDQRAKLKDLLGAEFRDPRFSGGGGTDITELLKRMRTASFGRYSGELTTLINTQAIKDDLKITEEQGKKLQEAVAAYQEKFLQGGGGGFPGNQTQEDADKAATERHAFVEKALGDILTADQRKRFRELILQYREQLIAGGFVGFGNTTTTVSVPGVAEEIKLSAEQKKKILDGTDPAEVLTGDQTTALKKLAGQPMKGQFNLPFRGGNPRALASTRLSLLDAAAINPELKLTADQEYKIALALEAYAVTLRDLNRAPGGKGPTAGASRRAQEEALAACEKAIDAVLTAEQKTRLAQLEVQGASTSLTTAFGLPAVAAKLALTADQKTRLDAIRADYRERSQLASSLNPRGFGGPGGTATASPMVKVREKARERMLAVLTDAQKAAWKELNGEPSKVPLVTGPGGGFGGGFGGGPRGIGIDP